MDDFKNAPRSVAEIRSEKTHDSSIWTPRDVLINLLREIDSGKTKPVRLIICWQEGEIEDPLNCYSASSKGKAYLLGLLERVKFLLMEV